MHGASTAQFPRWSIYAQVAPARAQVTWTWNALNISQGGLFMAGMPLLRPRTSLEVVAYLPGAYGPCVEVRGRVEVVWVRPEAQATSTAPAGMGCRFVSIDQANEGQLAAYLDELAAHRPADSGSLSSATATGSLLVELDEEGIDINELAEFDVDEDTGAADAGNTDDEEEESVVGSTLGSYHLLDTLGAGGMGEVYLAEHRLIGRKVAIKKLHDQFAKDPIAVRRFFDEAKLVNQIDHPNIVEITDLICEGGRVWFVMELLDGQTLLSQLRDRGNVSFERIYRIGMQLGSALDAVHRAGVIHRDLKPDNVVLVKRGGVADFVKLLDFGIAKLRTVDDTRKTQAGLVLGTPGYMAPEQILGKRLDARCDVYALGIILHEMVSGKPAYAANSVGEMLVAQATRPPPPPGQVTSRQIPGALEELIVACLETDPANRPSSARAVAEVLSSLAG